MENPRNVASTPLELTCTPIISSFIGSDVSPITDEDSFVNTQQTSTPKRYDLYCMYYQNMHIVLFYRCVNVEQATTCILDEVIVESNADGSILV